MSGKGCHRLLQYQASRTLGHVSTGHHVGKESQTLCYVSTGHYEGKGPRDFVSRCQYRTSRRKRVLLASNPELTGSVSTGQRVGKEYRWLCQYRTSRRKRVP
eukprot:3941747-Rhodomonas_salina.9